MARIVRHAGEVALYGRPVGTGNDRGHRPDESGVRASLIDANAVCIDIVKFHLITVYQPIRVGAGQVLCHAGVEAVGSIANPNDNPRTVLRHVHVRVERQGDVNVLAIAVSVSVGRCRYDLGLVGAVRTRTALDPYPERLVGISFPLGTTSAPQAEIIVERPSLFGL